MRDRLFMKFSGPLLRVAGLGLALGLLAGCVAPYAYVQPDMASSGGYYTSSEPYTGAGYYDEYGTGPYYPGTSGWGYYNGSFPYGDGFGYFGGYASWPVFFNIGFSSVWDFPGYWGPWYTIILPFRSDCRHWRCGYRHDRHHSRHWHGHHRNADAVESRTWTYTDHPSTTRRTLRAPRFYRPAGTDLADRHPVHIAAFTHDRFVHAPAGHAIQPGFRRVPTPSIHDLRPADAAWVNARARFLHAAGDRTPHIRNASIRAMNDPRPANALWANRVPMRISGQSRSRDFRPLPHAVYAPSGRARSRSSVRVITPRSRHHSRSKIP